MKSKRFTGLAGAGLLVCVLVFGGAQSASATQSTGMLPGPTCGPSQQVRITSTVTGGQTGHEWFTGSQFNGNVWTSGASHSSYTGVRVVWYYGVSAMAQNGTIVSQGAWCS